MSNGNIAGKLVVRACNSPELLFALIVTLLSLSGITMWLLATMPLALRVSAITLNALIAMCSGLAISAILGKSFAEKNWARILGGIFLTASWAVIAIRLASTSFAIHDEIYSWNMWAIQHALGYPADFSYTQAPYPQLLPYWMGSIYRALDDLRNQGTVRLFLSISFLIYFGTLLAATQRASQRTQWLGLIIVIIGLKGLKIENLFSLGLADPLMAATLLCSVACLVRYDENPTRPEWLIASVASAVAAAYTKQPALLWGIVSFPIVAFIFVIRKKWPPMAIAWVLIGSAICALWPLTEGLGFQHNAGVINKSMAERTWDAQILFASQKFLLKRPLLLILTLASAILSFRKAITGALWVLLILPTTLLWFLYGSYETRLGLHAIGLILLILLHSLPPIGQLKQSSVIASLRSCSLQGSIILAIAAIGISYGVATQIHTYSEFSDGVKMTIDRHYGENSQWVIQELLDKKTPLFTTSNYVYGVFYGHIPVSRPNYTTPYNATQLIQDIDISHAKYIVETDQYAFGPASKILKDLVSQCPNAFSSAATSVPEYNFTIYKINRNQLLQKCQQAAP